MGISDTYLHVLVRNASLTSTFTVYLNSSLVEMRLCSLLDETRGDKAKETLREKAGEYLERAEKLKKHLKKNKGKKVVEGGGGGKSHKSKKSGGGG